MPREGKKMVFFFDRNLSDRLARMVAGYEHGTGNTVTHQDQDSRFAVTSVDTTIVTTLSQDNPKPVFLTADLNMFYKDHHERGALRDSGLTCVFFVRSFNNLEFPIQAWKLMKIWPEIVRETRRCRQPSAFEVGPRRAKLKRVCATSEIP